MQHQFLQNYIDKVNICHLSGNVANWQRWKIRSYLQIQISNIWMLYINQNCSFIPCDVKKSQRPEWKRRILQPDAKWTFSHYHNNGNSWSFSLSLAKICTLKSMWTIYLSSINVAKRQRRRLQTLSMARIAGVRRKWTLPYGNSVA